MIPIIIGDFNINMIKDYERRHNFEVLLKKYNLEIKENNFNQIANHSYHFKLIESETNGIIKYKNVTSTIDHTIGLIQDKNFIQVNRYIETQYKSDHGVLLTQNWTNILNIIVLNIY